MTSGIEFREDFSNDLEMLGASKIRLGCKLSYGMNEKVRGTFKLILWLGSNFKLASKNESKNEDFLESRILEAMNAFLSMKLFQ